jgi:hypothetical protein
MAALGLGELITKDVDPVSRSAQLQRRGDRAGHSTVPVALSSTDKVDAARHRRLVNIWLFHGTGGFGWSDGTCARIQIVAGPPRLR